MTEQELRKDLVTCHQLVEHYGMGDTIYTHLSARLPEPQSAFLTTPFGLLFDEIGADDLIALDKNGRNLRKSAHAVNAAGFVIHSAIYNARPDVGCIIHTHTIAGVAVSALKEGLLPISQAALEFYKRISYHGYEGLATDFAECAHLVRDLGNNSAMILHNHGLLVAGPTIQAAFESMYYLEQACRTQLAALACGRELVIPPVEVCEHTAKQHQITGMLPKGARLWQAMTRKMAREYGAGAPRMAA
ncbi:MAG TPA: class II aldolase/adducin family protein [Telluria sp.]|nr:class II aldolase/adducin family protein [Telluria sp.]